jgi:hypothetical protein
VAVKRFDTGPSKEYVACVALVNVGKVALVLPRGD